MTRRIQISIFRTMMIMAIACLAVLQSGHAAEPKTSPQEEAKIQALITHMESLEGAAFIRNGKEYKAEHAGKFLRGKRKAKSDEIDDAEDFIDKAASYSGTTGKPYMIRFKDGKETTTNAYLKSVLPTLQVKG